MPPRSTTPVHIGTGNLVSPNRTKSQYIGSPRQFISLQEVSNAEPLETSIHGISSKHRDPAPTWSNLNGSKFSNKSFSDVYSRCWMNLARDTVLTKIPNFMDLGLSSVHTTDELGPVFIPTTRIGSPMHVSNWIPPGHRISEATVDRVSETRLKQNYNYNSDFETRRGEVVYQYFGRNNDSMSRPPLYSTPLGTNKNYRTTSPSDSIPVGTKSSEPTPLTLPTYSPTLTTYLTKQNGKAHVPGDPNKYPIIFRLISKEI